MSNWVGSYMGPKGVDQRWGWEASCEECGKTLFVCTEDRETPPNVRAYCSQHMGDLIIEAAAKRSKEKYDKLQEELGVSDKVETLKIYTNVYRDTEGKLFVGENFDTEADAVNCRVNDDQFVKLHVHEVEVPKQKVKMTFYGNIYDKMGYIYCGDLYPSEEEARESIASHPDVTFLEMHKFELEVEE